MKISNASKKVLASALSAAMVVAFAPTAAFGSVATNDAVTVKFDNTGLTVKNMSTEYAESYTAYASAGNVIALPEAALSGHGYTYAGTNAEPAGWYMDVDGVDGYDSLKDIALTGGKLTLSNADAVKAVSAGTTITLKPYVGASAVNAADGVFSNAAHGTAIPQTVAASNTLSFALTASANYSNLRASLTKDGAEIGFALPSISGYTAAVPSGAAEVKGTGSAVFTFVEDNAANATNAGNVKKGAYGAGKYALTVVDQTTGKVVATKTFEIVEVALEGIFDVNSSKVVGNKVLAVKGDLLEDALKDAKANGADVVADSDTDAPKTVNYYTVNGKAVIKVTKKGSNYTIADTVVKADDKTKVEAGMTLTPVYDAAVLSAVAFDSNAIKATVVNAQTADGTSAKYVIEVSGAATASKDYKSSELANAVSVYDFGTAGAAAGTYTVTVKYIIGIGTNVEKTDVVGTKDITLTQVSFDLGEHGKLASGKTSQVVASTAALTDVSAPVVKVDKTYRLVGWSVDGANVVTSKDKVGASAVTLKAVYTQDTVAAPTFSYANGKLTLASDAGAGYDVYYSTTATGSGTEASPYVLSGTKVKYTGALTVDPTKSDSQTIYAQVVKGDNATGKLSSDVIGIDSYKVGNKDTAVENWAKGAVAQKTGSSTTAKPQYYSELLKDAVANAKKAVVDTAYSDDWAKVEAAAEAEVLKAIAEVENASIDAAVAGAKQADGSMKKLDSAVAASYKAKIANVLTDFEYNTDDKASTVATDVKSPTCNATKNDYATKIAGYGKAALDSAATFKAEDVKAAEDVTAALKAAKTADEAKAAIEAYGKLSNDAKKLVDAADIAAANEIITKGELAEAQDEAAIAKVKGKTVKAKAKKATKSSLKVVTSKSGAKSTFKKTSGNSKVKVYKSGKIVVKNGLKAGKKYTVKVKATVGTQTKTVKVVVKVAK